MDAAFLVRLPTIAMIGLECFAGFEKFECKHYRVSEKEVNI